MKNIFFSLLFICIVIASCESFLGEDINIDPNKPSEVTVNAILPNVEIRIADLYGGDYSRFNCMISQQVEGVARQWSSFNQYNGLTPNRFDNAWETSYEDILIEVENMINISTTNGDDHYVGIGKILKAFTLMNMTDVWGDIPYTEAVLGAENINPVFDSQSTVIYPEIFNLLMQAEADLSGNNNGAAVGSDDVIYGGNLDNWKMARNAILARAYLRTGDYSQALQHAQNSFTSALDNLAFNYTSTSQAQWWRFNDGRTGDIEFHPFLRGMMTTLNDTLRLKQWDQTFENPHPYLKADYRQDLISYREIQFIIAECLHRTNGSTTAIETAYLKGIKASFAEAGLTEAGYSAYVSQTDINPGGANLELEDHILTQKYIGLFVQPEVFNDLRRNDFPNITPTSGTQIPVRWNYSADELLFNSNAPEDGATNLFTPRVGWDSN